MPLDDQLLSRHGNLDILRFRDDFFSDAHLTRGNALLVYAQHFSQKLHSAALRAGGLRSGGLRRCCGIVERCGIATKVAAISFDDSLGFVFAAWSTDGNERAALC